MDFIAVKTTIAVIAAMNDNADPAELSMSQRRQYDKPSSCSGNW